MDFTSKIKRLANQVQEEIGALDARKALASVKKVVDTVGKIQAITAPLPIKIISAAGMAMDIYLDEIRAAGSEKLHATLMKIRADCGDEFVPFAGNHAESIGSIVDALPQTVFWESSSRHATKILDQGKILAILVKTSDGKVEGLLISTELAARQKLGEMLHPTREPAMFQIAVAGESDPMTFNSIQPVVLEAPTYGQKRFMSFMERTHKQWPAVVCLGKPGSGKTAAAIHWCHTTGRRGLIVRGNALKDSAQRTLMLAILAQLARADTIILDDVDRVISSLSDGTSMFMEMVDSMRTFAPELFQISICNRNSFGDAGSRPSRAGGTFYMPGLLKEEVAAIVDKEAPDADPKLRSILAEFLSGQAAYTYDYVQYYAKMMQTLEWSELIAMVNDKEKGLSFRGESEKVAQLTETGEIIGTVQGSILDDIDLD